MNRYRGSRVGVIVQCEKGYVLIPSYSEAIAYDNDGQKVQQWEGGGNHHENWLTAVAAHDPKLLNAEIQEGHVSTALCHAGNVSYRVGKKRPTDEIARQVAHSDLLANSFYRMLGHLRANGVDVDAEPVLTGGEWLEVDPATEQFTNSEEAAELRKRQYREPFVVPDVESELS